MKHSAVLLIAAVASAVAQPHRHEHRHLHEKRDPSPVANVVSVPGPTVVVYELNGQAISEQDVEEGIRNGTLVWEGNGFLSSAAPSSSAAAPTTPPPPPATSSSVYVASSSSTTSSSSSVYTPPSTSSYVAPSSSYVAPSSSSAAASAAPSADSNSYSSSSGSSGMDTPFPSGEIDCSTFPSEYGAMAVDWMNLGGWTGIQQPGSSDGGFANIMTVTESTCDGGSCCSEGSYCSYACPAGYQKSQWPTEQGSTGQSVGGILCQNGKLQLTNPGLSSTLCMTGATEVTVLVKNELSQNAAVCRTDYPGTEGETVPLDTQPGTTSNLTCPDAANYYDWKGASTSAQYYVNPEGVSVQDACQWGSSDNPWGNFAPLNLGVGYSDGAAWLSIFQNLPTTSATLDFAVEITGDGLSGTCKYSNGQYCSGDDYSDCSSTTGCTVSSISVSLTTCQS